MSTDSASPGSERSFAGWQVIVLASYIHNCSYGAAFGAFGVSVLAMQERFGLSRATSAFAFSLVTAAVVLSAPVLGTLYGRMSIRRSIIAGGVLGAIGYACLAFTHDSRLLFLCYGVLLGPGVALSGSMPVSVLATRWFTARQGTALGIVNLPLGLMLVPLGAVVVLQRGGLTTLYLTLAALFLTIVAAAWPLVDDPTHLGQEPLGHHGSGISRTAKSDAAVMDIRQILSRGDFWVLVAAVGVIVGGSSMKYAHMVPLIGEQGFSITEASTLLALTGGAGAVGSLLFGALADRLGGAAVLIATALVQSMMWFAFLIPINLTLLTLDAIVIGMCGGGVSAAQGVFITRRFGTQNFSRVLGVLAVALTPFFVGINPLVGYLRDQTGSYRTSVVLLIVASVVVSTLLLVVTVNDRRRNAAVATA